MPDRVEGFVARDRLTGPCDPLGRRVTAIRAPDGFGKTTQMAEACRRHREGGRVVAWLTCDAADDAAEFATYLSFAFVEGGLRDLESRATSQDFERGDYRINILMHSIEVHGDPCVLAIDDVDRLGEPACVDMINRLLEHAPPNLCLAMTFREQPAGLVLAAAVLEGRGLIVDVEQLRFREHEIAHFFDTSLSRRRLAEVAEHSQGWPIALRIHRNSRDEFSTAVELHEMAAHWIEAHLWRGLAEEDRDFVLDVGLFEWIEPDLVDAVLGPGSTKRLRSIRALRGLLRSSRDAPDVFQLHPLLRGYCADKRFQETPARCRETLCRIADALARRNHVLAAMRHARDAGDVSRVGEIVESAGAVRLWLRHGLTLLLQIDELLTAEILERFPRLALLRCTVLAMSGELDAAQRLFEATGIRTDGFAHDREGGNQADLTIDMLMFRYLLLTCGCQPVGGKEHDATLAAIALFANGSDIDPLVQGVARYAMCQTASDTANFDRALCWAARARGQLHRRTRYVPMWLDLLVGNIAMAQGRVGESEKAYAQALRLAKVDFLQDPGPTVIGEVLLNELRLERSRTLRHAQRSHTAHVVLARNGAWLDVFVASAAAAVQVGHASGGVETALGELEQGIGFAHHTERVALWRCLVAMRVVVLTDAGRLAEAESAWSELEIPATAEAAVQLDTQGWRELEEVGCAGLSLLTAQQRFCAARALAVALLEASAERGLVRTQMRVIALAMALEHAAGNATAARARFIEYLTLYAAGTDYSRPALAVPVATRALLRRLGDDEHRSLQAAAADLRSRLEGRQRAAPSDKVPSLTPREFEVLKRLERWRDKEIGRALGITDNGVRYHVKSVFRKLGVRTRFEATNRARSQGILPPPDENGRTPQRN